MKRKCCHCPKELSNSSQLSNHEKDHLRLYSVDSVFKCDQCRLAFRELADETYHLEQCHSKKPRLFRIPAEFNNFGFNFGFNVDSPEEHFIVNSQEESVPLPLANLSDLSPAEILQLFSVRADDDDDEDDEDEEDSVAENANRNSKDDPIFYNLTEFCIYLFFQQEGSNRFILS